MSKEYLVTAYEVMRTVYIVAADSPEEAKRKFAKGAFTQGEMSLISATPVSERDILSALESQP